MAPPLPLYRRVTVAAAHGLLTLVTSVTPPHRAATPRSLKSSSLAHSPTRKSPGSDASGPVPWCAGARAHWLSVAGKARIGTLALRAYYSGDSIVLDLKDDGRGVNGERVLAKAIERGLAQPGQKYSREEIIAFLFHPGLSTAEKISDVSGRGVGMDVVKTNIQKLRGRIEMRSEEGKGSVVRMSLPLTMAIIDVLLVRMGTVRFILPVSSVNMTLNPDPSQIFSVQGNGKVIKHREQIFRLVHLGEFFRLPESTRNDDEVIVMVESDDCQFGLIVDEVLGKQEVVVQHLGGFLHNPEGVSGGAILGDGTISLILDPGPWAG